MMNFGNTRNIYESRWYACPASTFTSHSMAQVWSPKHMHKDAHSRISCNGQNCKRPNLAWTVCRQHSVSVVRCYSDSWKTAECTVHWYTWQCGVCSGAKLSRSTGQKGWDRNNPYPVVSLCATREIFQCSGNNLALSKRSQKCTAHVHLYGDEKQAKLMCGGRGRGSSRPCRVVSDRGRETGHFWVQGKFWFLILSVGFT